jgi:drug/metabolite transporter (DMT)-like permease
MKNLKYIFMVLLGGTLYGTMSSFVKLSYRSGYHAAEISFYQALFAALILCLASVTSRNKGGAKLTPKDGGALLFTGLAIGMTNYLEYASLAYIPASLAIILLMQYTWIDLLLEWTIFHRKPSMAELIIVAVVLIGSTLAGRLFESTFAQISPIGVALAIGSSLTYASYIVLNSRVGTGIRWQMKSMLIMTGSSMSIFAVSAPAILSGTYMSGNFIAWELFLSIAGTTIPTALFAVSIPKIGAGVSGILMTVELPVAVICALAILGEQISVLQAFGVVIMLASIAFMNYYKVSKSRSPIPRH